MRRIVLFCCLAGVLGGAAFGETLDGSYQFTATSTCNNSQCVQATDTLTGTGWNSVQGASTITATNLTETDSASPQVTGPFTLTSLSDGSELFGTVGFSFDLGVLPALNAFGASQFTGGTGPYEGFSASSNLIGSGFFTGPTTAEGTLTFAPEPQSWAELLLSLPALILFRRLRRNQS